MSEPNQRPELVAYLSRQRWFGGGEGEISVTDVHPLTWLSDPLGGLGVRFEIVTVGVGSRSTVYNVPLSYRSEPRDDLSYGMVAAETWAEGTFYIYDALHDPEARSVLLAGFTEDGVTPADLDYERLGDFAVEPDADNVLLAAEQSNTSVIVGEAGLVKFFRKLTPGRNPDIEIQQALTLLGSDEISPLQGWISSGDLDLAMFGTYQRSATDGWDSARASVRALLDDDVRAREAGGDFAGESERLGATMAVVHGQMRELLPVDSWATPEIEALVARLGDRFDEAQRMHGSLEEYADRVRAVYAEIDTTSPVPVQRVHGDLHLGQTLRTTSGWKIIDFEGEPAKPLEERVRLDSAARDVAGMLRSFDYAAHSVLVQMGMDDTEHAEDWVRRNRKAFLRGYEMDTSPQAKALLRAYEVDKAVYEVVYEVAHRPDWVSIPLRALGRLVG